MIITEEITYTDDATVCHGFFAYDNAGQTPKPTVMVVHDWRGRGSAACQKAEQLAQMGYAGFAIDMYGDAKLGDDNVQRRALITPFMQDRQKLAARITAAYTALKQLPGIDKTRIAAIGYCFGGLCVLDLARSGVDIKGVVSFHGLLSSPAESITSVLKSKVLVLHGYDDPLVKPDQLILFANEMTARQVDWQIHSYGLTQHSFTNPEANAPEMGLLYNQRADHRSWKTTELFLNELFD